MDNTKQIKTPEQWLIDEGYPVSMPISRDTIADIINQYVHQHPVPDASQPAGTETYLIYNNDKVNSMLSVALKNLDNEQLEVLRDCLIERTPQPAGNGWVSVEDRLPEDMKSVLVYGKRPSEMYGSRVTTYMGNKYFSGMKEVTHWQPLPPKP